VTTDLAASRQAVGHGERLPTHRAGEGLTVFVSSHLMSEMALTADEVVVLGRGRILTGGSTRTGGELLVRPCR
jgi:ABC-type multidrug transport system ATPase subunit